MKRFSVLAALAVLLPALFSCARTGTESATASSDRVLAAWVRVNYGAGYAPNDSGVYVLNFLQGTGATVPDSSYVFVHYLCKALDGNIQSTNIASYTEQLGKLTKLTDCGSDIWQVDQGAVPPGLEAVIKTLRVGGKATVALPVGQSKVTTSVYNAFPSSESANVIYEIELDDVVEDIYAWQDELLKNYSAAHYAGMDTLCEGFYFKVVGQVAEPDSIADDNTVSFWYIGRTLEGRLFDTNVRDTARKYEIYSSSGSYEPLDITYYKDYSTMYSNSSYVPGFTQAVHKMRWGDTVEVFFRSEYGYGAGGSTTAIPEYAPLAFRIWLTKQSSNDD